MPAMRCRSVTSGSSAESTSTASSWKRSSPGCRTSTEPTSTSSATRSFSTSATSSRARPGTHTGPSTSRCRPASRQPQIANAGPRESLRKSGSRGQERRVLVSARVPGGEECARCSDFSLTSWFARRRKYGGEERDVRLRPSSDSRCERAREWASQRADGELSELERLLLRRHIGRCEECRAFAQSVTTISITLRETEQLVPARRILVAAPPREPRRRPRLRVAFAVGLIALAAGLGAFAGLLATDNGPGEAPLIPDIAERPALPPTEEPVPTVPELPDDRTIAPV